MEKFIVRTPNGFSTSTSVEIADYVREVYPDVTVGELLQFARAHKARKDKNKAFLRPGNVGRMNAPPESRAYEYLGGEGRQENTLATVLALYKQDEILLEVLGLKPPPA